MRLAHFHKARTALQANSRPSTGADLHSARTRIQQGLLSVGWFHDVEVEATDDLDNLVIALCTFAPPLTGDVVGPRLVQLLEDRLRHPFWSVHTTLVEEDQVELEAATRTGAEGHYLTVHLVAQQVERQETVPAQRVAPPARRRLWSSWA